MKAKLTEVFSDAKKMFFFIFFYKVTERCVLFLIKWQTIFFSQEFFVTSREKKILVARKKNRGKKTIVSLVVSRENVLASETIFVRMSLQYLGTC